MAACHTARCASGWQAKYPPWMCKSSPGAAVALTDGLPIHALASVAMAGALHIAALRSARVKTIPFIAEMLPQALPAST